MLYKQLDRIRVHWKVGRGRLKKVMASLHPATTPTPSSSERSPLLTKPNANSVDGNANENGNIPQNSVEDSDDDDFDAPEPWTKEDKIHYSLLTVFILIVGITTAIAIKDSDKAKVSRLSSACSVLTLLVSSTGATRSRMH
jgi:hypothetical protein